MDIDVTQLVAHLVIYMVVLLLAISAHEAGHAWMSYKYGDDTAYLLGRHDKSGQAQDPIERFDSDISLVSARSAGRA